MTKFSIIVVQPLTLYERCDLAIAWTSIIVLGSPFDHVSEKGVVAKRDYFMVLVMVIDL